MRLLTNKYGTFSSNFGKIDEDYFDNTSLKKIPIDNYTIQDNKGEIFDQISLESLFGLCNTFEKVTKGLRSHITFTTIDLQNIVSSTLPQATIINVTFNILHLCVRTFISRSETQVNFNESLQNSFTQSFDSWTPDGKVVNIGSDFQLDRRYSVKVNSPKFLKAAHHTHMKTGTANKTIKVSVISHVDMRKCYVESDTNRCPKDSVSIIYATNDYVDQY